MLKDYASAGALELGQTVEIPETKRVGVPTAETAIANSGLQGVPEGAHVCLEKQSFEDTTRRACVDGHTALLNHVATVFFRGNASETTECLGSAWEDWEEATDMVHLVCVDQEDWMRIKSLLKTEERVKNIEVGFRRLDGDEVWVSISSKSVRNKSDEILYCEGGICKITDRERSEEMLTKLLQEKDLMRKEIHHRVKNNLQIISSLLNLQSKHTKDQEATDVFKEIQDRIKSIALIHEKLYESEDLSRIDMPDYIKSLATYLVKSYKIGGRVRLNLNMEQVFLGIDKAVPCGLVINELITNALKHAFPEGKEGEIRVDLISLKGKIGLIISDNGVGLPEAFDIQRASTLGMTMVRGLIKQLMGTVAVCMDGGTSYMVWFTSS